VSAPELVAGMSDPVTGPLVCDDGAQEGAPVGGEVPEIELLRPLPGFPDLTRYVLVRIGSGDADAAPECGESAPESGEAELESGEAEPVLYELRSLERPAVRFLVAVPTAFFPDYSFELDGGACAELELTEAEEAVVLVLLTIGDDSTSTTANLLAPVVINARTRSAAQVILSGTDWPVRAAVV
jgi:flagellar assembly factor FliW